MQYKRRHERTEQDLLDFVDTASTGLHWVGADGTILSANPADHEPLGYSAEECIGKHIVQFHADEHVVNDILRRLTAGDRVQSKVFCARLASRVDRGMILSMLCAFVQLG